MHPRKKTYLNQLREQVMRRFNVNEIHSSDCYLLSLEILKSSQKRLSETTLKRFFGFTSASHKPSQYTLDTLAIYCGLNSWNHFKEIVDQRNASSIENRQWMEVRTQLANISSFHIKAMNRRNPGWAGLKIPRVWVDNCMRQLEKGRDQNVLVIHAPAGFGKSLAVSTWVEERLKGTDDNIYLYLDGLSLFRSTAYGYNPVRWLADVLDFESIQGATEFLDSYHDTAPGHIHIIIDGFNEENIPENQYYAVFGNVLDIIEHFNSYNWLNFTFIVRSNIYEKLKKRLPPIYYDAWLRVAPSVQDRDPLSDKIQFSTIELSQLFVRHRINHTIEELALSSNYTWLRIPRYLESYLRLNKQYPNIDFRDKELQFLVIRDVIEKDVTLLNILEQTEQRQLAEWMRLFPCADIQEAARNDTVSKRKKVLLQSPLADKLIGGGILIKELGAPDEEYRFCSHKVKAYLYAYHRYHAIGIKNIEIFANCVKSDFSEADETGRQSFSWFIFFQLEDLDFSFAEAIGWKADLATWPTGELLFRVVNFANHLHHSAGKNYQEELADQITQSQIFTKILLYPSVRYERMKQVLNLLLELKLDAKTEFGVRLKMALLAFLKWDEYEFISQLEHLVKLQDSMKRQLSVNPVAGLSTIYHFFKFGMGAPGDTEKVFNKKTQNISDVLNEVDYTSDIIGYIVLLLLPNQKLATDYLLAVQSKMKSIEDNGSIAYALYDVLSRLLSHLIGTSGPAAEQHLPAMCPPGAFTFTDAAADSLIGLSVRILALHLEIAVETNPQPTRKRITELKSVLEPLGYDLMTKYFAATAYALRRSAHHSEKLPEISKNDSPKRLIN